MRGQYYEYEYSHYPKYFPGQNELEQSEGKSESVLLPFLHSSPKKKNTEIPRKRNFDLSYSYEHSARITMLKESNKKGLELK